MPLTTDKMAADATGTDLRRKEPTYPFMDSTGHIDPSYLEANPNALSQVPAAIARAQWDDYAKRFMPFEDTVMNQTYYSNPGIVDETIQQARPMVDAAINTGQQIQTRRLEALGQHVTPEAQLRMAEGWDSQRALARVDAANRIRQNIAERSRNIAFGGTAGASSAINLGGA